MSAAFLDCEIDEMQVELQRLATSAFNSWFDESPIKKRFKKACMEQQQLRCCYCQRLQLDHNNNLWDLEHILCESLYPQFFSDPNNLAVACKRCNIAKKQKDVLKDEVVRPPRALPSDPHQYTIPHPHYARWNDHLKHTAYRIYEYLTDEGCELISCCELNGKAEEAAGATPGAVRTAIKTGFFQKLGGQISEHLGQADVVDIANAAMLTMEEVQIEPAMKRLKRSMLTYERAARRRAPNVCA